MAGAGEKSAGFVQTIRTCLQAQKQQPRPSFVVAVVPEPGACAKGRGPTPRAHQPRALVGGLPQVCARTARPEPAGLELAEWALLNKRTAVTNLPPGHALRFQRLTWVTRRRPSAHGRLACCWPSGVFEVAPCTRDCTRDCAGWAGLSVRPAHLAASTRACPGLHFPAFQRLREAGHAACHLLSERFFLSVPLRVPDPSAL